jgi:hypothetical protein
MLHNNCFQRTPNRAFARSGAAEAGRYALKKMKRNKCPEQSIIVNSRSKPMTNCAPIAGLEYQTFWKSHILTEIEKTTPYRIWLFCVQIVIRCSIWIQYRMKQSLKCEVDPKL